MRRLAPLLSLLALFAVPSAASAADFNPAPGPYTVNTDTLKLTGPGTNITGANQGGVATFSFGNANIKSGVTITASGSRPLKIQTSGALVLGGVINGNGVSASNFVAAANAGGPGGGVGGSATPNAGAGPGGGGPGSDTNHGGGGGG